MVVVGMVGVQHELRSLQFECGEILIGVMDRCTQHLAVEGKRSPYIANQQVHGEPWQRAAVIVGRHPTGSGALHGHGSFPRAKPSNSRSLPAGPAPANKKTGSNLATPRARRDPFASARAYLKVPNRRDLARAANSSRPGPL